MAHKHNKYHRHIIIPKRSNKVLKYPESPQTEKPYDFYLLDITTGHLIHGAYTKQYLEYFVKKNYTKDSYKYEIIERPKNDK